jgi:serine/threonine protein kinase
LFSILGAFGRVVGAYKKTTGHEVAVKIIEKQDCGEQDIKRINEEANNLYKFNHVSSYLVFLLKKSDD